MASPRSDRYAELPASLASQLPQVPGNHTTPPFVRVGLPAMAAPQSGRYIELSVSLASQLPQIPGSHTIPAFVGARLPAMAAPRSRSGRYAELSASLASQLPQIPESHTIPPFVGAGLARDGSTAVRQVCRVVCIAGKPAPTGTGEPHHSTLCGSRACPRWLHRGPAGMPSCLHRWRASSNR